MTGPQLSPPEQWPAPQGAGWIPGYGAYGERPAPRPLPLSKAAITSLVFGLIGGVLFAYIFGFVGLRATGRNGFKRGRGFAVAGLILATVWLVAVIGLVAYRQSQTPDRNADGSVKDAGTSAIFDLQPGDCLKNAAPSSGTFTEAAVVPCTQPHHGQVAAQVPLAADSFDLAAIQDQAAKLCPTAARNVLSSDAPADLKLFYLVPDENAWNLKNRRTGTCVVSSDSDLTKSYITTG